MGMGDAEAGGDKTTKQTLKRRGVALFLSSNRHAFKSLVLAIFESNVLH